MNEALVPVTAQPWRTGLALLVFAGLFGLVTMRLHHLQVDQAEHLAQMGEKQRTRTWTLPAARGNFYDAQGAPLAVSDGTWTISCDPVYMDDRLRATVELARILGQPRDRLREQFESPRNGRLIAKGVDDDHAEQIRKLNLTGIYVRREFTRRYPEGPLAAHVLGFVQSDGSGGAGLEQSCNALLGGIPGHESVTIDALGKPSLTDAESVPAQSGAHVQLTIDATLQRILEQALLEQVEKSQPANAAAIMVRPSTGEIVAMASWPSFDPSDMTKLQPRALRDNVIAFVYEPGSTMKPLIAGATVAEGLTTWAESIFCEHGRWTHREGKAVRTITDHSVGSGGHGNLTVTQGIALSDNILMAKLGIRLGVERLFHWVGTFCFGRRTGICLPGEDAGIVLARPRWSVLGSCMSIPMGHEIAVTPLQLAMAHAATANHGVWLPPRLVRRIYTLDDHGRGRELPLPVLPPPRRTFSVEDAAQIQEAMTHTMTEGTGRKAELSGYTAAGKTGTAEKLVGGHYSHSNHVGSFVCWAPAEPNVEPELLCLVVIDDPSRGGHYGAETAAPVVQKVLQASLEYLHVPKRADLVAAEQEKLAAKDAKAGRSAAVAAPVAPAPAPAPAPRPLASAAVRALATSAPARPARPVRSAGRPTAARAPAAPAEDADAPLTVRSSAAPRAVTISGDSVR